MYTTILKTGTNQSVKEFIEALTESEIREMSGTATFNSGKNYAQTSMQDVEFIYENKLIGSVEASDSYEVIIEKDEDKIVAECDCNFAGELCDHTAAVLVYAITHK